MTDTTRDLIQRMATELDLYRQMLRDDRTLTDSLADEARAYLAQPEPEGLTDEPLGDLIDKWVQEAFRKKPYGCKHPTHTYVACKAFEQGRNHAARTALSQPDPEELTDEELLAILSQAVASFPPIHPKAKALSAVEYDWELEARKARAVIAADRARWGRPAIKPVPVQPEGRQDLTWIGVAEGLRCVLRDDSEDAIQRAWQRSRILDAVDLIEANCLPVPVAERLPGEGDCDPSFQCWWFTPSEEKWILWPIKWAGPECSHWLPHYALPIPTITTETP